MGGMKSDAKPSDSLPEQFSSDAKLRYLKRKPGYNQHFGMTLKTTNQCRRKPQVTLSPSYFQGFAVF